jgi:hypothetical protein
MTLVIDAGHGGQQTEGGSSALGVVGPSGVLEKNVTLDVAGRLAGRLGRRVLLTRSGDQNRSLAQRIATAKSADARVFLSIHANGGSTAARGAEVWLHDRAGPRSQDLGDDLARTLGALGEPVTVRRGNLAVLTPEYHAASTAAALVEVDYLSSPDGERRLTDPGALEALATSLADGAGQAAGRYGGDQAGRPVRRLADALPSVESTVIHEIHFWTDIIAAVDAVLSITTREALVALAARVGGPTLRACMYKLATFAEGAMTVLAPLAAMVAEFVVLGLPYAEAREAISLDNTKRGFSYGVVLSVSGHSPQEVADHPLVWSPAFPENPFDDAARNIALRSYQIGLIAGMANGRELTQAQRKNFWFDLIARAPTLDWERAQGRLAPDDHWYADVAGTFRAAHLP